MFFEFLKESYFVVFYALTLIVSIKTYGKYFDTAFKYLPIIIAYTLINELLGYFLLYYPSFRVFLDFQDSQTNHIIYNIFDLIYFPFFYYAYWKLIKNIKYKKIVFIGAILVFTGYLINSFYKNPMNYGLFYAYAFASAFLIITIILYHIDKSDEKSKFLQPYNLVFWVSIALVVFYTFSPMLLLFGYHQPEVWYTYKFQTIHHLLIILLNILFIIGFIKCRKRAFE